MKKVFIDGQEVEVVGEHVNGDLEVILNGKRVLFEHERLELVSEHYETINGRI